MDVDEKPTTFVRRERNLDVNFVDDDELQAALARSRRSKARKINKLSPEEIAQRGMLMTLVDIQLAHASFSGRGEERSRGRGCHAQ